LPGDDGEPVGVRSVTKWRPVVFDTGLREG
jgi:hypothetical protein